MSERILLGHFLTRAQASARVGIPEDEVLQRPDLLRIGGRWLEEVYFEFQFDGAGVRHDLAAVVQALREDFDDVVVADWLARRNDRLEGRSPLAWLAGGGDPARFRNAANGDGPRP